MWFGEENVDFLFVFFLFSSCRWSQNLAEQISPRRPKLPGGRKLRVCAHRPLLKRATAGLLLNVRLWGLQGGGGGGRKRLRRPPSCDALPPPLRGGGAKLDEGRTWYSHVVYCVLKFQKKKEGKKPTHARSVWGGQRPRGWAPQFCFLFRW